MWPTGCLSRATRGDEFALWMPGVDSRVLVSVIAGIRARLRAPLDLTEYGAKHKNAVVLAAIGAACCPGEAISYDTLRQLADKRMYEDKARLNARPNRREITGRIKRKGAVDPAPQSFLPR